MSNVVGNITLLDRFPYGQGVKTLPVNKETAREHVQVYDTVDDGVLFGAGGYVASATEEVENRGQVALITQKRRLVIGYLPGSLSGMAYDFIFSPVTSILQVKYLDVSGVEQTLASDKYRLLLSGGIYFNADCPAVLAGPDTVWIDFECGYGNTSASVPAVWQTCVLICATNKYERREGASEPAFERSFHNAIQAAGRTLRYG
jgi:uncharacterized phiE125 gp8 family phage protein